MKYNVEKGDIYPNRTLRSLEGRWSDIKEQVAKFEAYLLKVHRENRSGKVDTDKTADTVELYNRIELKPFTVLHCWKVLHNQPKWTDLQDKATHANTFVDLDVEDGDSVSHAQDSTSHAGTKRPLGRDASKAAKNASSSQSVGQSSDDFASLMSTLHVDRMGMIKENNSATQAKFDKLIALDKKKLALKDELVNMKRIEQDDRILGMDLNTLNPMQYVMYEKLQRETLARWMSRDTPSSGP
ncbi:hypothetical protein BAE44_0001424 [Dichanthelium oligosanthes]|uniref:No apical meristem-associated C-terminal domain-containing protein n=1 Tax=Dichanthelium oligosanthes TaxID=888268 RepID=A0A1E5WJJ1_9POAL|nr:hypothetical protein BAE44_0001424 [Dichanthelium oligosanthes]